MGLILEARSSRTFLLFLTGSVAYGKAVEATIISCVIRDGLREVKMGVLTETLSKGSDPIISKKNLFK